MCPFNSILQSPLSLVFFKSVIFQRVQNISRSLHMVCVVIGLLHCKIDPRLYYMSTCCGRDEDWYDNDGALNTVSQWYPRLPSEHPNCELGTEFKDGQVLQPGIW